MGDQRFRGRRAADPDRDRRSHHHGRRRGVLDRDRRADLTSTQFGPRMLRNFIRDRGTQLTLGTFVATFVYSVLNLGSVGQSSPGSFVPHIGVTVTLFLMLIDLAVLIYFLHHV